MKGLLVVLWQPSEATRHPELPPYLIVIDAPDEIKAGGGSILLLRNRIRGRVALATAPRILVLNFHSRFLDSKLAKKIFVGACGYSISKVIFLYLFHITLNLVSLRFATQAHV